MRTVAMLWAGAGLVWLTWDFAVSKAATLEQLSSLAAVKLAAAAVFVSLWACLEHTRQPRVAALIGLACLMGAALIAPAAFRQGRFLGSESDIHEFSDWSNAIPPTSTVFVAPTHDVGAFVWFVLNRPNYLALDQSAGVVFSRDTALEVRRRSEVVLPLTDPTWKILSGIRHGTRQSPAPTRPLTTQSLIEVCTDPELGFVISPVQVGFEPIIHAHAGAFQGWNLYDCRRVRGGRSST